MHTYTAILKYCESRAYTIFKLIPKLIFENNYHNIIIMYEE